MTLLDKYYAWIRRQDAQGIPLTNYPCPSCRATNRCNIPVNEGDVYDSAVSCPHCDRMHFKVVDSSGNVTAEDMGAIK